MRIPTTGTITVAALLLLALATSGCESTPLLAPSGASLTLLASPIAAAPDPKLDPTEDTYFSTIYGQMLDTTTGTTTKANAAPLVGVSVTFSATSGNLRFNACNQGVCGLDGALCPGGVGDCTQPRSQPLTVETDSSGVVQVLIAVTADDPGSVTINALSGALTQNVSIGNPLGTPNDAPVAVIGVSPESPADASGGPITVTFFSESTDPDGDEITCYEWTINSSTSASFQVRGPGEDVVSRSYSTEQSMDVLLRVTDDPDALASCTDDTQFSPDVDTLSGYLVCTNTAPTASFVNSETDLQTDTIEYTFDGSASDDAETNIARYQWNCGAGQEPTGVTASCTYTRSSTTRFFEVELVVTDSSAEPGCAMESEPAVQTVTVPALEG